MSAWLGPLAWTWMALLALAGMMRPARLTPNAGDSGLRRVWINVVLGAATIALAFLFGLVPLLAAWASGDAGFGLLNGLPLPEPVAVFMTILLADFGVWLLHVAMHRFPWLWALHRVHHSDAALDVLTTYRQHPAAAAIALLFGAAFTALLGLDPLGVGIYQALIAFQLPLHHANIDWRIGERPARWLSALFVVPGQHAVHHSAEPAHFNSNYGQLFSFWDRAAGSRRDCPQEGIGAFGA